MTDAMFTDHFFTNADGLKLHYRDYPAVGETTGLPVLCLHGLTRNVKDFEELAPRIAGLGRRVIVASQRGRGQSEADPQTERYIPPVYAGDMIGLLDQLGLERVVFIGTSMGGLMTMMVAGMQPQRIAAAVINDIGPSISKPGLDRIKQNTSSREPAADWAEAASRTRDGNLAAFPLKDHDEDFWLDFARKTWIEKDGQVVLAYDGNIISMIDGDEPLPDIWEFWEPFGPIPTLVVRGGVSDLLSAETVAEMKRRKPDLDTVEVPDVGHAPFMTEPEAWTAIQAFLGRVD